jgi:hypothetical protein
MGILMGTQWEQEKKNTPPLSQNPKEKKKR